MAFPPRAPCTPVMTFDETSAVAPETRMPTENAPLTFVMVLDVIVGVEGCSTSIATAVPLIVLPSTVPLEAFR